MTLLKFIATSRWSLVRPAPRQPVTGQEVIMTHISTTTAAVGNESPVNHPLAGPRCRPARPRCGLRRPDPDTVDRHPLARAGPSDHNQAGAAPGTFAALSGAVRTGSGSACFESTWGPTPAPRFRATIPRSALDFREADLTKSGPLEVDYVLRAEALLANARRAIASGADAQMGTLALAASGIPGTYLLPSVVARFHAQHPAVVIDFVLGTSAEALEAVRSHHAEVAVVGGLIVPPELEAEPLLEDEVVLVGPPSVRGGRLRPKDLEGFTWVSREEGSSTRAAVEAARWQMGLHAIRQLQLPSWEAVKLAV